MVDRLEPVEFFAQLKLFSLRYFQRLKLGIDSSQSPWVGGVLEDPVGAVLHYTADSDFHRVLSWFMKDKFRAGVSAHVVVADRKYPGHDEAAKDLELVQQLPVTVVQCVPPDVEAVHATWCNSRYYGIENVNSGELKSTKEGFMTWRPRDKSSPDWTTPWELEGRKSPVHLYGRWWEPYSADQVATNIIILQHLNRFHGQTLEKPHIIPHECVQSVGSHGTDKRDTGPAYPIWEVRDLVYGGDLIEGLTYFQGDPIYGRSVRDGMVVEWAKNHVPPHVAGRDPQPAWAWLQLENHLNGEEISPLVVATALRVLGYDTHCEDPNMESSVRLFQRGMGLSVDGYVGRRTFEALSRRVRDRGYFL